MLSNYDYFLSSSLQECCENFYNWDLYSCTGTTPALTNGEYYPDWDNSHTCVKDGQVPEYMFHDQSHYLSPTLQKCCEKHFSWQVNDCVGTAPDAVYVGTGKWYVDVDWDESLCVQDCNGESPCGGPAEAWDELYSSREQCCKMHLSWNKEKCNGVDADSPAVDLGTLKWYVKWDADTCAQDCAVTSSPDCGGIADSWQQLYSSKRSCCDERMPLVRRCLTNLP